MMKIEDRINTSYKRILRRMFRIPGFLVLPVLVVAAGFVGLGLDFKGCFGQSVCSRYTGGLIFILPLGVLVVGLWVRWKYRQHRDSQYYQQVKSQVLSDLGQTELTPLEQRRQLILQLIREAEKLTTLQLQTKTGLAQDELLSILKDLMREGAITQISDSSGIYFRAT